MSTPFSVNQFSITNGNDETDARVAVLANGGIATVYYVDSPGTIEVRVSLRTPDGAEYNSQPVAGGNPVEGDASIAALLGGGFVVSHTINGTVFYSIFDNSGSFLFQGSLSAGPATDPRVTGLANGNFVVVWAEGGDFRFQICAPDGTPIGPPGFAGLSGTNTKPEVAALADGGFVIVGTNNANNGDPLYDIYDENGNPVSGGRSIDTGTSEDDAFVFGLVNNTFVSVYSDPVSGGAYFKLHQGSSGDFLGSEVTVAGGPAMANATGVGLSDGGFIIAWSDSATGDIFGRAFDSDGNARGFKFEIADSFAVPDTQVSVAEMADGRVIFTWKRDVLGDSTIWARIFDPRESAVTLNGTTFDDSYMGTAFADTMRGSAGNDLIEGKGGHDVIEGDADDDRLLGGAGNDILRGGSGDDYLEGGTGFDQLIGGSGDDFYAINDMFDTVFETADGGFDTIETTVNVNLLAMESGAFIERVSAVGSTGVTLIGNSLSNQFWGHQGGGADILIGGDGHDVYIVSVGDFVIESNGILGGIDLILSYDVDIDLGSAAHGNGNVENATALGDIDLTGTAAANTLDGSNTSDANVLTGLNGDDTYYVGAGDTAVEAAGLGTGTDTVGSSTVNINLGSLAHGNGNAENATALNTSTISLTGNGGANMLDGLSSTGANALIGLGGSDIYVIGTGDTITETAGGGTADEIESDTIGLNLNLFTNVENARLYGTANLNVTGNGGANLLEGNLGINVITGGLGRDTMTGGAGADDFKYTLVNQTGTTAATRDRIMDFQHLVDDIDLQNIDANGAAAGNTAFQFRAAKGAAFTGFKGQIRWFQENVPNPVNDKTIIQGDINGDKIADFTIELKGLINLTAADFIL